MTESPLGDVSQLLHRMGRSSTPDVPESGFGITALDLIFGPNASNSTEVIAVAAPELLKRLLEVASVTAGIPGLLSAQAESACVTYLIIDEHAFHGGPWLGASSGGYHHMAEDIFEAGRLVRARGGNVLYVPSAIPSPDADLDRIKSTATDVITEIPENHFEENAPQSALWCVCSDYAHNSAHQEKDS